MVALARFTFAPGAGLIGPSQPGPGLIVVESGSLTVQGNGTAGIRRAAADGLAGVAEPIVPKTDATVSAGDALVVQHGAPAVRNDAATPAEALGLALVQSSGNASATHPLMTRNGVPSVGGALALAMTTPAHHRTTVLQRGLTVRPLATAVARELPSGPIAIDVGRVLLVPHDSVPAHHVSGLQLLVVEAGTLDLGAAGPNGTGREATVHAGDTVAVRAAAIGPVRSTDARSLALLVVTIEPLREPRGRSP